MAWTRTALAVLVSGVLLLFKGGGLSGHFGMLVIGASVSAGAASVFGMGVRRRRALHSHRLTAVRARAEVVIAGASILAMTSLIVAYLLLPVL